MEMAVMQRITSTAMMNFLSFIFIQMFHRIYGSFLSKTMPWKNAKDGHEVLTVHYMDTILLIVALILFLAWLMGAVMQISPGLWNQYIGSAGDRWKMKKSVPLRKKTVYQR